MGLILAKRVVREHPNGFVGAIVEGRRGVGKSSYCIKVMKEVYQTMYDLSDKEAYQMALDHILFDLDDVIPFLKKASMGKKPVPIVTWDDAGVHGSNLRWFTNMHQVEMLKGLTDTIRTGVTGFIINCPDREGLLRALRNYNDLIVSIVKAGGGGGKQYQNYSRIGRGYTMFKLPSGTKRIYKSYEDEFSCYIPKYFYEQYMEKRKKYFKKAVEAMEEWQEKVQKENKFKKEKKKLSIIEHEIRKKRLTDKVDKIKDENKF